MYHISLSPGSRWNLIPDPDIAEWTELFARICGFPFISAGSIMDDPEIRVISKRDEPIEGMRCRFSDRFLDIYRSEQNRNWILGVNPDYLHDQTSRTLQMNWALYPLFYELTKLGGILVHASFLEKNGRGILIIAPGGTGKSTCARRIPEPWNALCDDLVLLFPTADGWSGRPLPTWSEYLWGTPCDLTWQFEKSVPISLLCYLSRGETDQVLLLGKGEAVHLQYRASTDNILAIINRGGHTDDDRLWWRKMIFQSVNHVIQEIPFCRLEVSLEGEFWEVIDEYIKERI